MNLLINVSNLRFGGGLAVGLRLVAGLAQVRTKDTIYLLYPQGVGYEQLSLPSNVKLIPVPNSFHHSFAKKLYYNQILFPKWCREWKIDKMVSLGNVAIPVNDIPQLLLIHLPHIAYPEALAWWKMSFKTRLTNKLMVAYVRKNAKHAKVIAVQTPVMAKRLALQRTFADKKFILLPNAVSADCTDHAQSHRYCRNARLRLLMLSKYYAHKNFEILIQLAQIIVAKKLPATIDITIDKVESNAAQKFLQKIETLHLQHIICNIGHVKESEIGAMLHEYDALFLPTLLESYTGVYTTAIQHAMPIFTSKYDFATEILQEGAFYFDPMDAEGIYNLLEDVFYSPRDFVVKSNILKQEQAQLQHWQDIGTTLSVAIDVL